MKYEKLLEPCHPDDNTIVYPDNVTPILWAVEEPEDFTVTPWALPESLPPEKAFVVVLVDDRINYQDLYFRQNHATDKRVRRSYVAQYMGLNYQGFPNFAVVEDRFEYAPNTRYSIVKEDCDKNIIGWTLIKLPEIDLSI